MRKTNIALIVAVVMASPIALAGGYNHHPSPAPIDDIVIEGSGNDITEANLDLDVTKTATIDNVANSDDDLLVIKDVGNDRSEVKENNSDWSEVKTDNSNNDRSMTVDIDIEINKFLADSDLDGEVTYSSVVYSAGEDANVVVNQTNHMNDAFGGASGINIAGQNVGNNSLVQQTTSTNAVLVGSGGAVGSTGSTGHGHH